jgi:hypothetical protein
MVQTLRMLPDTVTTLPASVPAPTSDVGVNADELREQIEAELRASGFVFGKGRLSLPDAGDDPKDVARRLHRAQRRAVLTKNATFLDAWEDRVLTRLANGTEVRPDRIRPRIVPVQTDEDAALFRFATLHWSVPVSQGYGRRTRFLLLDESNERLIGVMALGDPVFNLGVRDRLIGWDQQQRQERLYSVYDAYVLGAVEPYRQLIAGKLVALAAVANETSAYLEEKYAGTTTVIRGEKKNAAPVLVTTTSALGRSSIYNRLKFDDRHVFKSIGYTQGFGHFHFSDEVFAAIVQFVTRDGRALRGHKFGEGPNWRIRTLRRGLEELGFSGELLKHGIRREVFIAPRAVGWRAYLRGESDYLRWFDFDLALLSEHWRERWAKPRSWRDDSYRGHTRDLMRLTPDLQAIDGGAF